MAVGPSLQAPCADTPSSARPPAYTRRRPEETVLHAVVREELETFLARAREREHPVPRFVEREFRAYLACGMLEHGFVRVRCDACGCDRLVAFSCKGRAFCRHWGQVLPRGDTCQIAAYRTRAENARFFLLRVGAHQQVPARWDVVRLVLEVGTGEAVISHRSR